MTVSALIDLVLGSIRGQFYADREREFFRDRRQLMQAVSRYGHECFRRNWEFAPQDILRDIMELLQQIKRTGAEWEYFPIYLEGAVDRHIRVRAEELSAQARKIAPRVEKVLSGLKVGADVRQPTACEVLSTLYSDLKQRRPRRSKKAKQPDLFSC